MTEEQKVLAYYTAHKAEIMEAQQRRRRDNPNQRKAHDATYRATNAEKVAAAKETYRLANLGRVREAKKRWRLNNPEKMHEARKAWEQRNPEKKQVYRENRRASERNAIGKLSPGISAELLERQKGECAACSTSVAARYELDHIMPLCLGGTNEDSNLQVLCRTCNRSKGKKHPSVFAQERGLA